MHACATSSSGHMRVLHPESVTVHWHSSTSCLSKKKLSPRWGRARRERPRPPRRRARRRWPCGRRRPARAWPPSCRRPEAWPERRGRPGRGAGPGGSRGGGGRVLQRQERQTRIHYCRLSGGTRCDVRLSEAALVETRARAVHAGCFRVARSPAATPRAPRRARKQQGPLKITVSEKCEIAAPVPCTAPRAPPPRAEKRGRELGGRRSGAAEAKIRVR